MPTVRSVLDSIPSIPAARAAEVLKGMRDRASDPWGIPEREYAVPSSGLFPLDCRRHVESAISLFPAHRFRPDENRQEAARRILAAAKRYGIVVSRSDLVSRAAENDG